MKILIAGCGYGAGNIGDEAILSGMIESIRWRYKDAEITVMSFNPEITEKMHRVKSIMWLKLINWRKLHTYIACLKKSDVLLLGGGTLADDSLGLNFPLISTSVQLLVAKLFCKPVVLYGIGANKPRHFLGHIIIKYIYRLANLITTRDLASFELMRHLGFSSNKIYITADHAYGMSSVTKIERTLALKMLDMRSLDARKNRYVAISVLNEAYSNYQYKIALAEACDYIIEKHNMIPVFVCHEARLNMDPMAMQETIELMRSSYKVKVLSVEFYSPREMLAMLSWFHMAVGMRMHMLMLAIMCGIPVLGISRADKVDNLFAQMESDLIVGLDTTPHELKNKIDLMVRRYDFYAEKSVNYAALQAKYNIGNVEQLANLLQYK